MGDDWELEAVQEQFEVFDNLTVPYRRIGATELKVLTNEVKCVISQHWRVLNTAESTKQKKVREISAEIIKKTLDDQDIKFSFIIIVTNQDVSSSLCKMPVFTIISGSGWIFIDMNCSVYNTWTAFMETNDLPACKFCFPVNGRYNFGKKLMIDFAKSPAATGTISRRWVFFGVVVAYGLVAATYFFSIPPAVFSYAQKLIPIAKTFLPRIASDILTQLTNLATLVGRYRDSTVTNFEFTVNIFRVLQGIFSNFKEEISAVWEEVNETLKGAYNYICRKLSRYYEFASDTSRHTFLAITGRVDSDMSSIVREAEEKLNATQRNTGVTQDSVNGTTTMGGNNSDTHRIFEDCKNEYALNNGMNQKDSESDSSNSQPFSQHTQDLLTVSVNIANNLQSKTLNDVQDIFESLSSTVAQEFKYKINTYTQMVNAARAGAGHEIDFKVFNESLGIMGDPKEYYWNETISSIQKSHLSFRMKEKLEEFQRKKKIFIIPITTKSENDNEGLYKSIGIHGAGTFSSHDLLGVLREQSITLDENNMVVNETNSQMYIHTEEFTVLVQQEVDEENTSEGLVYVSRNIN